MVGMNNPSIVVPEGLCVIRELKVLQGFERVPFEINKILEGE